MSEVLLDVSALIALLWPHHEQHDAAHRWFARNAGRGWATCPLTQVGFVRIVSNPAFSPFAVSPREATHILSESLGHRSHRFWPLDIAYTEAARPFESRLAGHLQVTDAYLVGLAIHKQGTFATLDRRILGLLPEASAERKRIELIGA